MRRRPIVVGLVLILLLSGVAWTATKAEPGFELTARYILEIVKAFRTAYVPQVMEHTSESGTSPRED